MPSPSSSFEFYTRASRIAYGKNAGGVAKLTGSTWLMAARFRLLGSFQIGDATAYDFKGYSRKSEV